MLNTKTLTLLLCASMTIMAGATIAPALPVMQQTFASTANSELLVKLVLTIPALVIALSAFGIGALVDSFGRKPVLLTSLALYAVAGSSGLWLQALEHILIGRALLGAAVAGIMTSTTALLSDYFKGPALSKFMGLQTSFIGLSGFIFLTTGGYLAEIDWQLPFTLYLFALMVLPLAAMFLNTPESTNSIVTNEPKSKTTYNWIGLLIAFFGMTSFYLLPTQLPFVLQRFETLTATDVGLVIASITLATSVSSLFYGKLKSYLDFGDIFAIVFMLLSVGIFLIGVALTPTFIVVGAVLAGIGTGWLMPNLNVWFVSKSAPQHRGKVIGALTTSLFLGQFTSPLLFAPLQSAWGQESAFLSFSGLMAALCLASILISIQKRKVGTLQHGAVQ